MKDFFNIKKEKDENSASIIRIIRPGSDDYDDVHDVAHKSNIPEYFEESINDMLNSDKSVNEFAKLYIDRVNESILKGKVVSSKAYAMYNILRNI